MQRSSDLRRLFRRLRKPFAPAVLGALALSSSAMAAGDMSLLTLRVADPPVRSFDLTALGRARHTFRLALTNPSSQAVAIEPVVVLFRPTRDGITYDCDVPTTRDDRWPTSIEPGGAFAFSRETVCDTPLPGRYDVEIRGRYRSAPAGSERLFGTFPLQIEPGQNPPVRLPWDTTRFGAASGTKDLRPNKDPNSARMVVAVINATRAPVTLTPLRATLRVTLRGSSVALCGDRGIDLSFSGTVAPGARQTRPIPLGCALSVEGTYDVDVWLGGGGKQIHIATHSIRVRVNGPDTPGPQDLTGSPFLDGN